MPTFKQVTLSLFSFLIVSIFFLSLPEEGHSGIMPMPPTVGCCTSGNSCVGCTSGTGCAISDNDCAAGGGNFAGVDSICVDNGAVAECQSPDGNEGCCVISQDNCQDQIDYFTCNREAYGIAWYQDTDCSQLTQCTQKPIPTLSEWGMIAIALLLGIAGFFVIRRRKVTA